ncbi:MAG: F0F1 ATP synthase subunit B [Nitrospinae bacterium]|nr:F0F1 ATP synthase subunit B [Nitrospinota bacterium]
MLEFNGSFLIQLVNFFVMMFFLQKFLFKPVLEVVEKRNKALGALKQDANNISTEADKIFDAYNKQSASLKTESSAILAASKQKGTSEQERLLKEAREKQSQMLDAGLAEVESRIGKVKAELGKEAEKLSVLMASKLLGRAL